MADSEEDIARRLRCVWFSSVQEIADLDLQRRAWLDPTNRNPHWSYVEFANSYPDEERLADARAKRRLTTLEFDSLDELRRVIETYSAPDSNDYDHAAILGDPAWLAVVEVAKRAQQRLMAIVTNPDEQSALRDTPSPNLSP